MLDVFLKLPSCFLTIAQNERVVVFTYSVIHSKLAVEVLSWIQHVNYTHIIFYQLLP